ncbi:MAG: hypothetical protein M3P98_01110 [bacterium]|nr:hypothetical protein [bacterium]
MKNNPYLDTSFDSKKKETDNHSRSIVVFIVVVILLLTVFVVGIFLGNSRSKNVISEKDQQIADIQANLDEANKQIDSFSVPEENITKVNQDIIADLLSILNESKYDEIKKYTNDDVSLIVNYETEQKLAGEELIKVIADGLNGAEGEWTPNTDTGTATTYKDGEIDEYFTENSVIFETENDFIISFTFEGDKLTKVFIINE